MSESNGSVLGYIHDGYTRMGYVKGVPLLYPSVRFEYRVMLTAQRLGLARRLASMQDDNDATASETESAKAIAGQMASWDLKDNRGKVVPLKPESFLRVEANLSMRIGDIVMGNVVTDVDPQWGQEEGNSDSESVGNLPQG